MKIYFNLNITGFSNCYIVVNEDTKEALIIDPGKITGFIIDKIEADGYKLKAVLITHNHGSHVKGLKTLLKIYSVDIYAADWETAENQTSVIKEEGELEVAGLKVQYISIPGHTSDSMVYKIGNVLFTGDTLSAGKIGSTDNLYRKKTLKAAIRSKIFSQPDDTVIMPGHGPMTTVGAEKQFNSDVSVNDEFID